MITIDKVNQKMVESEGLETNSVKEQKVSPFHVLKLAIDNGEIDFNNNNKEGVWENVLNPDVPNTDISNSRIIGLSNLSDLAILMDAAYHGHLDSEMLERFVRMRMRSIGPEKSAWGELEMLQIGIRKLYDGVLDAIIAAKDAAWVEDHFRVDMQQTKYKISTAATILKIERATLNNWSNSKGGYIRSFQFEGSSKFVLEVDLKAKYKEIVGKELIIDDEFRKKHGYYTSHKDVK